MMFDASAFGVAVVTDERFSEYPESSYFFNYAWKYDEKPRTEGEEKEVSE